MKTEIPLYGQEKDETCALACLRMVLAARGTHVEEHTLEAEARMEQEGGTDIEEWERLARQFGLTAQVQQATVAQLRVILEARQMPIVYLSRAVFELPSMRLNSVN